MKSDVWEREIKLTREGENDGEDAGLKEEDNHEHAQTSPVGTTSTRLDANSARDEYNYECLERNEDVAGLSTVIHEAGSCKASNGEESLCDGVKVGALVVTLGSAQVGTSFSEVVDEVGSDSDLSRNISAFG